MMVMVVIMMVMVVMMMVMMTVMTVMLVTIVMIMLTVILMRDILESMMKIVACFSNWLHPFLVLTMMTMIV